MSAARDGYVLTLGESMGLVRQETPGRLGSTPSLGFGFGGAESNVAIGLQRLGTPAVWAGRLGVDGVGDLIERELRAEGVQTHITRDADAPTGLMLKERPIAGITRVVYYRSTSAAARITPADLPDELIAGAALVHVTGITPALSASARETIGSVVARARQLGVPVSLDINYRSALWSAAEAAACLTPLVRDCDLVFAGTEEAELIVSPGTPAELAAALRALGPVEAVIKLGSDGCFAADGAEELTLPAVPITAVDTVGAGDAFVAGYLSERVAGHSLRERITTAVAAGAFACLAPGDWEGLPRRQDLTLLEATEPVLR